MDLLATSPVLPRPLTNVLLTARSTGERLRPDALLESSAVVLSTDSRELHEEVADWSATLEQALVGDAHGLRTLHLVPAPVRAHPRRTLLVVEREHLARAGRGLPAGLRLDRGVPPPRRARRAASAP